MVHYLYLRSADSLQTIPPPFRDSSFVAWRAILFAHLVIFLGQDREVTSSLFPKGLQLMGQRHQGPVSSVKALMVNQIIYKIERKYTFGKESYHITPAHRMSQF